MTNERTIDWARALARMATAEARSGRGSCSRQRWTALAFIAAALSGCSASEGGGSESPAADSQGVDTSTVEEVSTGPNDSSAPHVDPAATSDDAETTSGEEPPVVPVVEPGEPTAVGEEWLRENSLSLRSALPIPYQGQILHADVLAAQLAGYDPGSLLRCAVSDDAGYRQAIDALGGVTWGYGISLLEDQSKPQLRAGYQLPLPQAAPSAGDSGGGGVEIEKPDVVAVTEAAALYYSKVHGLLVVSLEGDAPTFKCATQLPGWVNQFFFHDGHLVAMTKSHDGTQSALLHFQISGSDVQFVESVSLGNTNILDSRRFNDKLVFYTDMNRAVPDPADPGQQPTVNPGAGIGQPDVAPWIGVPRNRDRALHVYRLGETLERETYDTLIDTSVSEEQLYEAVDAQTPPGTQVNESHWFGYNMWASDHYFVVTEQITKTLVDHWQTDVYNVCTDSHTDEVPYTYCWTEYETRPNPDYVEPDNSGGDRSCQGITLSDCLVQVARVSNKTIQVPVGSKCEERIDYRWYCDAYEQRTAEYPVYRYEDSTRLYIYEYTDAGFLQVDSQVHEIASAGLEDQPADAQVETVTASTETYDLAVPGAVQTLYFQNGYLYVISQGVLQVYAMGGGSLVRTATLPVVNETLQSSLFTSEQLFLSDFGWSGGDHSTLRVVDLSNPAFPKIDGSTHELPGGHQSIIASEYGIFTVGSVQQFMGQTINALKLGLFSNPYAEETAYLIVGTDFSGAYLSTEEAQYFDAAAQRLVLPYSGQLDSIQQFRVGLSHIEPGSIVSEGAVVVPEPADRVRRLPYEEASYLTFGQSSVEWLTPADAEWQRTPILEYLLPTSVYRVSEQDDYVEFQRLGQRCRLYFANASDINQRQNGVYSEEFECTGWPTAYANRLIFTTGSVEFNAEHEVRLLSEEEVTTTRELIAQRPVCVLSDELVDNTYVDPNSLPDDAVVTCMTQEEYWERSQELLTSAQ